MKLCKNVSKHMWPCTDEKTLMAETNYHRCASGVEAFLVCDNFFGDPVL
jgi:hypothetical protein